MGSRQRCLLILFVVGACLPAGCDRASTAGGDLQLVTGTLPVCQTGDAYSARLQATGGVPPYSFARTRGDSWPDGLALDPDTGLISGSPAVGSGGAYFVDVGVTDASNATVERRLTLIVSEPGNEFGAIRSWILPTCAASACHSEQSHVGDLVLVPELAYPNLLNIAPANAAALGAGKLLVSPGNPDQSFFYLKILGDLQAGEGSVMPQAGVLLPDTQVTLVRQWIEQGALPYDDDPIDQDGGVNPNDPSLEIGQTIEQIYNRLNNGDDINVWFGTQGGVWIIPTIRATGLDTTVTVEATLTHVSSGQLLGQTTFPANMTPTMAGTELQNIIVPLSPTVGTLFGTDAVLWFRVIDDEEIEVEREVTVVLEAA